MSKIEKKDIVILSERIDVFTTRVEEWLRSLKRKSLRINSEIPIKLVDIKLTSIKCDISVSIDNTEEIQLTDCCLWHRRGFLRFCYNGKPENVAEEFVQFLLSESKAISNGILMILKAKNQIIGKHIEDKINKLYNLYIASTCGLEIPNTYITNSKKKILEIHRKDSSLITKPISDSYQGTIRNLNYVGYVNKLDIKAIDLLPETFFPMLFQQEVDRLYEVRTFYFCGEVFSMATIVSENDKKIKDIKEVGERSKRYVPYELPVKTKDSITSMMREIDLDTASFDFVMDKNGKLYFLELNQFGQLNEMSYHCNYSVEEFVSNYLIGNG